MDASAVSRGLPAADVVASPQAAGSKAQTPSENPPEKVVAKVAEVAASDLASRQPHSQSVEETKLDRSYVTLPDNTLAYRVADPDTKQIVYQSPSPEAVQLRAYLDQQERMENQRREAQRGDNVDTAA